MRRSRVPPERSRTVATAVSRNMRSRGNIASNVISTCEEIGSSPSKI
jgi:hypothetical protein